MKRWLGIRRAGKGPGAACSTVLRMNWPKTSIAAPADLFGRLAGRVAGIALGFLLGRER